MTYTNTYAGADGVVLLAKDADDQFDLIEAEFAALPLNSAPGPIGSVTPSTGAFTTLSASGTVSGAGITARFSAPGPIGDGTPSTGAFTTLSASGAVSGTGFSSYLGAPPPIGNATPNTGAFTAFSATSAAITGNVTVTNGGQITQTDSAADFVGTVVTNNSANALATSGYSAFNSAGDYVFMNVLSTNYAPTDAFGPGYGVVFSLKKMCLSSSDNGVFINVNGGTLVGTFTSTGLQVNGTVKSTAGTGTGQPVMVGTLSVNTTAVGNVGAGTDDLMTYTLPADSLSANNKGIRITAWGTAANNANGKNVLGYFGSMSFVTINPAVNEDVSWRFVVEILRTASNTQIGVSTSYSSAAGVSDDVRTNNLSGSETDSGAITIKFQGVGTANNDVVQKGMIIEFIN